MTGARARQPKPKLKHRQASSAADEAFVSSIAPATPLATHKTTDEGFCRNISLFSLIVIAINFGKTSTLFI